MSKIHPYYNFDKLYSFNGTYNFLVGGRGLGKTYGAKVKAVNAFFKNGDQFIYLRRYKNELTKARTTFFADIEHLYPDSDFRATGATAEVSPVSSRDDKKRKWLTMGYFVPLSTSQMEKSVAFPRVKTIIFDEFIIERGAIHYLPDEATVFNNLYSTVDRWQDKTKVFFLANSVSIMNPHFIEYEIRPDEGNEFVVKRDGFIVCHFPEAADFQSSVYETKFGKFIKDSEYANYSVGNDFADNGDNLLQFKGPNSHYQFSIECRNGTFSVWYDMRPGQYFVQARLPKDQVMFTMIPQKMDEHKVLLTFSDKPLSYLRGAFKTGKMMFDSPSTRNTFTEIFKR